MADSGVAAATRVPFYEMGLGPLASELTALFADMLEDGQFIGGPRVDEFEDSFAAYCDAAHCVGVASGTAALHLALLACDVGPGDEVITTPATFIATVAAIVHTGARPVLVDIDPVTYTIDAAAVEAAFTPRTKAVIPVDLYGQPADLAPIKDIAHRHDAVVIEDAAQAHGARYRGRRIGSISDVTCFSFYPAKNLGALGDAGAITTDDADIAEKVRSLLDHGRWVGHHDHRYVGFNARLDALQAGVLSIKLPHLYEWIGARRRIAGWYTDGLSGAGLGLPQQVDDRDHVFHLYVVTHPDRDALRRTLDEQGIATGIHYATPVHLTEAFAFLGHAPGDFPVAERLFAEALSLPMFPGLDRRGVDRVTRTTRREPP